MTLAIVDDHKLLTEALSNGLKNNPDFAGEILTFQDPQLFLATLKSGIKIEMLLIDLLMPKMQGLDVIQACKQIYTDELAFKIIIMTSVVNTQMVRHALSIGANGYLTKDAGFDEVMQAIAEVRAGQQYIGKVIKKRLLQSYISEEQINFQLTPREKEVLQQLCKAKTVKEIAFDMGLSTNTVLFYQKNIMRKFKMNRTVDLVTFAIEHGIYSYTSLQ